MRKKTNLQKGFTLIEIIVSLAVFMMVAIIATGSMIRIVDAGKKAQAMKAVINNLQFALEMMSREIRTGTKYHCSASDLSTDNVRLSPKDCADVTQNNFYLYFEPSTKRNDNVSQDRLAYRFNQTDGSIERADSAFGAGGIGTWIPITSPEVTIKDMRFVVTGSAGGDSDPAKVHILISGEAGDRSRIRSEFTLQTMVTQRLR